MRGRSARDTASAVFASTLLVSTVLAGGGRGAVPGGPGLASRHWPAGGPCPAGAPDDGGPVVLRGLIQHVLDVLGGYCCAYR